MNLSICYNLFVNHYGVTKTSLPFKILFLVFLLSFGTNPLFLLGNNQKECFAGTLEVRPQRINHDESNGYNKTFSQYSLEELRMFGVVLPPKGAYVQDRYKGIYFLASPRSRFSQKELEILKSFIDRAPCVFLRPGPSAIITWQDGEVRFPPGTPKSSIAVASGPYIFFNIHSLETSKKLSFKGSIENNFRAFIHELVHVKEFQQAVKSVNLNTALKRFEESGQQTLWNLAALETDMVRSFMEVTGWRKEGSYTRVRLQDRKNEKTSLYGKKNVLEDIAETLSFLVLGNTSILSEGRIQWGFRFLGKKDRLQALKNTFPYSDEFKHVKLLTPGITKFNKSKIVQYEKKYWLVDLEHFVSVKSFSFPVIISYLEREFPKRGWKKKLIKREDMGHGVRKEIMEFKGKWRDLYLEAITYDYSKGYIIKPKGTIITVLNGYKDRPESKAPYKLVKTCSN